jgi:outer membrane protein TolC
MRRIKSLLCVTLLAARFAQPQSPQDNPVPPTPRLQSERPHWYSGFANPYTSPVFPQVGLSNSPRLESLMRAGKLYLSLSDAIALAVENNLDVEVERYIFPLAEADLLRAQSGATAIGIPTAVLPGIATSPAVSLLGNTSAGLSASGALTLLPLGESFDPFINGTVLWGHATSPQSNTILVGTTELVATNKTANFNISQTFLTGGTVTLSFNNLDQTQNSFRNTINPAITSSLDLTITQPLLQGFGLAVNNRPIRVARNDLKAADLVFKQQLINTVANVVQLYWTLVAANLNVDVKKQAVDVSARLVSDNQKQVEVGTMAPIEIVRAEAQVASDQQALVLAQSTVLQLEAVLKSALSRNGLSGQAVSDARVVALDQIHIPEVEPVQPIQDLVAKALENRPDLAQSNIQIDNSRIALQGYKNALLPTLNAVADLRNNALIGSQNTVFGPPLTPNGLLQAPPVADSFFVGGFGGVLGQLFGRNFPNYSVGVNLTIPLRNRAAQSNIATAALNLRMSELTVQRQVNQIRVDIQNALIALQEARAQHQAAVKQRDFEVQTVDADQKKLALGATTVYQLIQDERDLSTAGESIAAAEAAYAQARAQLDVATGATLQNNNVEFDEAKSGRVTRPPNPLPPLESKGTQGAKNSTPAVKTTRNDSP